MELWEIFDENRNPKGYTHIRGEEMKSGDYHINVNVWIMNGRGEFFLTKRSPEKVHPGFWECTGGSVIAGDTSIECAVKETYEEAGIVLDPADGELIHSYNRMEKRGMPDFCDVWFFRKDFDLSDVVLQEGETCDAMWASKEKILKLLDDGKLVPVFDYLDIVLNI
ncbi:MAG: NUDIX domain-containing protein [Clostridia bacterium]|nr:NUDIX domain-containing protein [Clostridia bacterium]